MDQVVVFRINVLRAFKQEYLLSFVKAFVAFDMMLLAIYLLTIDLIETSFRIRLFRSSCLILQTSGILSLLLSKKSKRETGLRRKHIFFYKSFKRIYELPR